MGVDKPSDLAQSEIGERETTQQVKIHVESVGKRFGRITAIEDITLDIYDNEIFALIGDNGAGKSTLMNILCGIYSPTNGTLYFDGDPMSFSNPSEARAVGIETVYQDLALMNDLDVATNMFMGQFPTTGIGPLQTIDWDETYRRTEHIIHEVLGRDIDPRAEVEFLSGGERQLAAIGRALAFDPDLIILDEPTSALSIDATQLVHDTVRQLKAEGHTIVVVSHSIESVLELADRIGVLYQGRLVEVTTPDEVDLKTLTDIMVNGTRNGD
jgi:ABC-type sugar transport system ATPase subunit